MPAFAPEAPAQTLRFGPNKHSDPLSATPSRIFVGSAGLITISGRLFDFDLNLNFATGPPIIYSDGVMRLQGFHPGNGVPT